MQHGRCGLGETQFSQLRDSLWFRAVRVGHKQAPWLRLSLVVMPQEHRRKRKCLAIWGPGPTESPRDELTQVRSIDVHSAQARLPTPRFRFAKSGDEQPLAVRRPNGSDGLDRIEWLNVPAVCVYHV